jgi:hypothetical protein
VPQHRLRLGDFSSRAVHHQQVFVSLEGGLVFDDLVIGYTDGLLDDVMGPPLHGLD